MPSVGMMLRPVSGYIGPGDVVSGAVGWWGLMAYSRAKAGTKAVNVFNETSTLSMDINTLPNGQLDVATLSTFLSGGAAVGGVNTLYDQSGNGNDLTNGIPTRGPFIVLGQGPGGIPALSWTPNLGAPFTFGAISNTVPPSGIGADPITVTAVYMAPAGYLVGPFCEFAGRHLDLGISGVLGAFESVSEINETAAVNVYHAVQADFAGTGTSSLTVDAATITGTLGAAYSNASIYIGAGTSGTPSQQFAVEFGLWNGPVSSLVANMRSRYGI